VRLSGGAKICEMTISGVVPEDAGAYRCVLADREDIVTVARNIDISVGVAAVVSWVDVERTVSVEADKEIELACLAEGGFPEPSIEIVGPDNIRIGRAVSSGLDITQNIVYTAREGDSDSIITCTATQVGLGGAELYSSSVDTRISVSPAPSGSALAIPIGGIIGIVLGILLLFLLCALCIFFFLCWPGMKKKQKKEVEDNVSETSASSESEYEAERVTSKTKLTDIQVVSESSQQQGYIGGFANVQGNYDAQTIHTRREEEQSLLKVSDDNFKVMGNVKESSKDKKSNGYFPGKYEEEYNQQKIEQSKHLQKTSTYLTRNKNTVKPTKISNQTNLQRITEEGDLYESYNGQEKGYEGGVSSEGSGHFIFAQKNNENLNKSATNVEKTESDIVLKIIHNNCDNKIQEVNQRNLESLSLIGKINTSNSHSKHSTIKDSNSQDKLKSDNLTDKNWSQSQSLTTKHDFQKTSQDSKLNKRIQTTNVELMQTNLHVKNMRNDMQDNKKTQTINQESNQPHPSLSTKETQTPRLIKRNSSTNSDFSDKSIHIESNQVLPAMKIKNETKMIQDPNTGLRRNIEDGNDKDITKTIYKSTIDVNEKRKVTATNSTSASTLSEYEANYEAPHNMQPPTTPNIPGNNYKKTQDPASQAFIDKYTLNQYTLNDCDTINTKGMTYTEIIEEHLSRHPSVQTSKSSIELKRGQEHEKETTDESFAASSPSPSYKPPSEYKQQNNQVMYQDNQKEKKSKYSKITEKYVQNAVTDDPLHGPTDKNIPSIVSQIKIPLEVQEEELSEYPSKYTDFNKNKKIIATSNNQQELQEQENENNSQENISHRGHLTPNSSYVSSAKEKQSHREVIESHLYSKNTPSQMNHNLIKNEQGNNKQFPSGSSIRSNAESESIKTTRIRNDSLFTMNKMEGKQKAERSAKRESIINNSLDTEDIHFKHRSEKKKTKEYLHMLREKKEYLRTGSERNTHSQINESEATRKQNKDDQKTTYYDKKENENTEKDGGTKKYIITQQEIVFYLKNADGVLRIIHRPLMSRKENENVDNGKVDKSLRVRRLSQPNLHTVQSVRQEEGSNHIEIKPEESKRVKLLKNEEKHITNVGVIHQSMTSPAHGRGFDPITGYWRSSGSIFDCEQGCFSDNTVII